MLGRFVATCLVLGVDRGAEAANLFYAHRAQPLVSAMADLVAAHPDVALRAAAAELCGAPADGAAYRKVRDLVADAVVRSPERTGPICAAAWTAISRSRLDYWIGDRYGAHEAVTTADLVAPDRGGTSPSVGEPVAGAQPEVLVVIPFRDRSAHGTRARNLLACLRALRDQSIGRRRYRVCVVESDDEPRWRAPIAALADDYLFAPKSGAFNKCWTVNVGVRWAPGDAGLICVLDADALVDRDFLARNRDRFDRPGTGGFLPFRDLFYLDAAASDYAIDARCRNGTADLDRSRLRGFLVHRAPGVCVWLRRDVFDAVNGMDERYEGWGREDMDFVLRLQLATAFLNFDDQMYHLHHPPSAQLVDGQTVNAHIPWLTWQPEVPIGALDRFAGVPA